ncbi:MAG TPA: cytochrome c [Vicinamibacterales bacterium]|nr:cytochrome c [Vicinamibacterales bacterium]
MPVLVAICALVLLLVRPQVVDAQAADRAGLSGEQLYRTACAACHGNDGRGQPIAVRGFDLEPPDFTDCHLTTPEADLDWYSVIHEGGPARAFNRMMPAFGDELSDAEIAKLIGYLRGFCKERGWPLGDLNMPRAFVTEKAFPENEAVLTTTFGRGDAPRATSEFLFEHRVGRRGQYEIFAQDLDEVGGAYKHVLFDSYRRGSILAGGGEIRFNESGAVFEAFGAFSQALPLVTDGFLHAHAGIEVPTAKDEPNEVFWRTAVGKSFMLRRWSRAWTPIVELLAAREIQTGAEYEWDALPQLQISLSTRQHVLVNVGARVPLTQRAERRTSVMAYLLWDWFDGGFLSGW